MDSAGAAYDEAVNPLARLLGDSDVIEQVREQVQRLLARQTGRARRHPPILILGETGTGKGLLASAVHRAGPRAAGPFIDVNCAAIPETLLEAELFGFERGAFTDAREARTGLVQAAHGGILFLDEIGLLGEGAQAKLLKVLEERTVRRLGSTRNEAVDLWLIAATSDDLDAAMRARRFREDLYHRLAVVTLRLPPLRERGEDIVRLAEHFLAGACGDYGLAVRTLSPDARASLRGYPWPGNVRELANVMERVALLSEASTVTAEILGLPRSPGITGAPGIADERRAVQEADAQAERARLLDVLRATAWNISRAAVRLGLPRNTLRYRLEKHGLTARSPAEPDDLVAPSAPAGQEAPSASTRREPASAGLRWESRRVTLVRGRLVPARIEARASEGGRGMEIVLDKVRSFGGQVSDVSVTGILAAFGLEPVEDAPRRAAHASLAIARAVARAREGDPSHPEVQVGIHTAEVPVARVDGDLVMDADARDAASAVLDALLDRAAAGGVLVSTSTAAFLRRWFDLAPHGVDEGAPGPGYRLRGPLPPDRSLTPFVGRERELGLLIDRLERARAGQGQITVILGDPGIGKTRVLHELRRRAADTVTWLEGHAVSSGRTMPFHPLIDLFRRMFGIQEGDPDPAVSTKIEQHVLGWSEDLRPILPFVRALLAIDPADPVVVGLEAGARQERIFEAVDRLFLRAAETRPVVMVYEDAHGMDQATGEYLGRLADSIATGRILMILTARPDYSPPFAERSYHTRLALQTLSTAESVQLARALLTSESASPALQAQIVRKAEGNPFFLEEIVKSLQEVGALLRREGDDVVDRPADDLVVPDTIQDVLFARVARLEEATRHVLDVASAIGKNVSWTVLRAIAGLPADALRLELSRLLAAELLYESRRFPDLEYTFRHALTHEVAYGAVAPARRRILHARIVETIEALHAERLEDQMDVLAHHADRAELWDKAVVYARRAGLQALARSANRDAVASFEGALRTLRMIEATPDRRALTVDVLLDLRTALRPLGAYERILEHLREAETLAGSLGDARRLARIATDMTHFYWVTGQQEQAIAWGERAAALGAGDVRSQAVANHQLGRVYHALGDYRRAIDYSQRSLAVLPATPADVRAAGSPGLPSRHWLVWSLAELGEFRTGMAVAQEAVSVAEADGRPVGLLGAYLGSGYLRLIKGDLHEAISALERALELCQAWQFPAWFPPVASALARAYTESGRAERARPLAEAAVSRGAAMRLLVGQAYWTGLLADVCAQGGRVVEAAVLAERALSLCRERRERGYEAWVLRILGEIALLGEPADAEKAATAFREARALAEQLGMRPLHAHCHLASGRLYRRAGDPRRAADDLTTAARMYREMDMRFWLMQADAEMTASG